MIIDTHCHFDMMPNPEAYLRTQESLGNITIGMTNLPSHFDIGFRHMRTLKHSRLALGFHPLLAHRQKDELNLFDKLINNTSYIGEIGLDFSKEGISTQNEQISVLEHILRKLEGQNKIVSVHSRGAEKVLFELLNRYHIKNVIFHWYTGPISLIPEIAEQGYYFSINEKMTKTASGRKIISQIPQDKILTETDAPYNQVCSIENALNNMTLNKEVIYENFKCLLNSIKNRP